MAATNAVYTKGSLAKELNLQGLIRNRVVDGVVQEGQHAYAWTKMIEETNNFYESRGTGNKMLFTYKDEIAYTGDPTIKAQVSSSVASTGGSVLITFTNPDYQAFRENDQVALKFGGNLSRVVETGLGYIKVAQAPGHTAPVAGDFPAGKLVIQYVRAIDTSGTKGPAGVYIVPQTWENYCSITDDGGQQNLFASLQNTVISDAEGYITIAPVKEALQRFFRNNAMTQFLSKGVNPESTGMNQTATKGIHQQIQDRGTYAALNSLIQQSEFENYVRNWFLSNPGNDNANRIIRTGSIGMKLISTWYKDYMKFDATIAVNFTDGSINGLNATRIYIPGFEYVNVVRDKMLDMQGMGTLTSLQGFEGLPQTSGNFYFLDFSPVQMQTSGMMAPAFQKIYMGNSKYFYSFQRGLTAMESLGSAISNGTALTVENMELTSTDNDFNSFRIYSICGINVMNPTAHCYLENKV